MADGAGAIIVFIGGIVAATLVATTLTAAVTDMNQPIDAMGDELKQDLTTDLKIISDPSTGAVYDNSTNTVTVLVKNTGQSTFRANSSQFDILIDGEYYVADTVTVVSETNSDGQVDPGEVVELTVDTTLNSGEHEVRVFVFKASDNLWFTA